MICTPKEENTFNTRNRFDVSSAQFSRTLFGVFAISFLLWLLALLVYMAKNFCPRCISQAPVLHRAVCTLRLANSMVDPLVYSLKMPAFKYALGRLQRRWRENIEIRPEQEEKRFG